MSVKLIYLPQLDSRDNQALMVRSAGGSADDPVVLVNSVTYTSPAPDEELTTKLTELLGQWFNANLQAFTHVFTTVNLGMEAAEDAFKWLYPTHTTYAYHDAATLDDSLLGVLCMTESRDAISTEQQLSAGAIPGSARAGFSISAERFLNKMVLPSLMAEFTEAAPNTFQPYSTRIDATAPIPLNAVHVAGVKYHTQMTEFRVSVENDQLITYAFIHTPVSPGIDAYAEFTYNISIVLGTKKDGTRSLTYKEMPSPKPKKWHTIAPWVEGVEITASVIVGILAAAVTMGSSVIASAVLRAIVACVVGGVAGAITMILEKIPEWIAGSVPDALPSVDALVINSTASTEWADGKDFELTTVLFNGALQFGGNPGFPTS